MKVLSSPLLKERLFGLTGSERNHGEDVRESYFYWNSTPTHSYMRASRMLASLMTTDTSMCLLNMEKNSPNDILIRLTICKPSNRCAIGIVTGFQPHYK
jgi:hypothetical protein